MHHLLPRIERQPDHPSLLPKVKDDEKDLNKVGKGAETQKKSSPSHSFVTQWAMMVFSDN